MGNGEVVTFQKQNQVLVGDLYTISELYGQLASCVVVGKLWQLAICIPLASSVAVGKLWQLAICTPLASYVTVTKLYTRWQAL